jgi:hypothetical protein
MVRKYNEFAPSDGFLTRRANERDDRCERRVSEFIGRETIDPFGKERRPGNTEKMWDNSGRKKPHKTLKIRAGKMAVTVEILPR